MPQFNLSPRSELLSEEYVLVQAWKKAHDYIRRHNWYSDVLELDLTNADIQNRLDAVAQELHTPGELQSNPLRLVIAPKSQEWDVIDGEWLPVNGPGSVEKKLRPLAHLTARDQIIGTAFMLLLANLVENRQGDPRGDVMQARARKVVSYGHRLFCDEIDGLLRYRWGSAVVYRQYFQDYQAFISRPQQVVDAVFGESKDWAIVNADLSQFYDRVRPTALHQKVEQLFGQECDAEFLTKFRSFFHWTWHPTDETEARNYSERAQPPIEGMNEVALPQGLVASGFFANVCLIHFDEAVCAGIDQWHDDSQWQLVDFCRYVDDMRIVVRLGESLRDATEKEIVQIVTAHFIRLLNEHADGMILNPEKCSAVLGRNASAGSIRVSATMKRINHNTSGAMDMFLGEETIDLIEGLFSAGQEEPLDFKDRFSDTFFAAKRDVRDETVARFAANRFRRTFRSLRPMCDDDPMTSDESFLPALSRESLDNKAAHFCRRLIEQWVRDPSNMRLLRVALDVNPDPKSLDVVLGLLEQYVSVGAKRKAPRRVAWYCAAELLKAGATETGLVSDEDCLPESSDLKQYQEKLADFAEKIVARKNTYPWYLEQQAFLYLACVGRHVDRRIISTTNQHLNDYLWLHHVLAGRPDKLSIDAVVPFVFLQRHLQDIRNAAKTFLTRFVDADTPTQRKLLHRILQEDSELAESIRNEMSPAQQDAWNHLYYAHGITLPGGFPETEEFIPGSDTTFSFLSVAKSAINPFQQEYAALHFARALLRRFHDNADLLFPSRIKIRAHNWRALLPDNFPILPDTVSVELDNAAESDIRFRIPGWVAPNQVWKYQLGQILRVLLTGNPDFTISVRRQNRSRSHVLYSPYYSSWLRRRYGLFNGRNAFGPPWLPISSWLGSLLTRLLEWPGFARFDFDFELPDDFDEATLLRLIDARITQLEDAYGRASRTPVLPIRTPKLFMRSKPVNETATSANLYKMRVGIVQTVIPRREDFLREPELNSPAIRRQHRRHLSAVLGGVHRMLQVRETHRADGSGVELVVFPELAIHPADIDSHLVPFVLQHRCIVFAGLVFHRNRAGCSDIVNSAYWLIPVRNPRGGLRVEYVEQGKWNLTEDEKRLAVTKFRPAQWVLEFVDPFTLRRLWSMTGAVCYDSTDLHLAADLRDRTDMFVIPALNQDVGTFDNMAAALHYHMFQHVIVANTGEYGGSTGQAPFNDRHQRTIFHSHGNDQASITFFEVDLNTYRYGSPSLKTPPAGYRGRDDRV